MPQPVHHCSQYETSLRTMVMEAGKDGDLRNHALLVDMIASMRTGNYGRVRQAFDVLKPLYQNRLGQPPTQREADTTA